MRSRWPSSLLRSPRSAGIGVVAALVAGSLALAFGSGYVANKAVFSGSSAWVREGDDAVLVSAGGGAPQGRVADVGDGDLVTGPDGTMIFTSGEAGGATTVERYDPDAAGAAARTIEAGPGGAVLANEAGTWNVNRLEGTVTELDPDTWEGRSEPFTLADGLVGEALGTDGALWVLDGGGAVRRIDGDGAGRARSLDLATPAASVLVVAGDRAVVVDPEAGRLLVVGGDVHEVAALRGSSVLALPSQPGPWLVVGTAVGTEHHVVALGPDGPPVVTSLGPDPIDAPLALGTEVYVPTASSGSQQLRHLRLPGLQEAAAIALPRVEGGTRADPSDGALGFEAFLVGTRLWANDPAATDALTIGEDGAPRTVAKVLPEAEGSGDDPDAADPDRTPEPQEEPPPSPPVALPELPAGTAAAPSPARPAPGAGGPSAPVATPGGGTPTSPSATPPLAKATTQVPDVDGLEQEAACEAIAEAQLACVPRGVPDKDRTEGEVYDQSLEAGRRVDVGTAVEITFAVWGTVTVPDLTGDAPDVATTTLQGLGLVVEATGRVDATADTLMNQVDVPSLNHAVGAEVQVNTTITFDYYTDYTPLPYDPNPSFGIDASQADPCAPLTQQGFRSCSVTIGAAAPNRASTNVTYEANPPVGTPQLKPFDPIVVAYYGTVTEARTPAFPGGCPQVEQWRIDHGMADVACTTVGDGAPAGIAPPGVVVAQTPAPNEIVGSGDSVTIHTYEPPRLDVPDWFRTDADGTPSANHVLTTADPNGALRGPWTYQGAFGLLGSAQPGTAHLTCWYYQGTSFERPECHLGDGEPAAAQAPTRGARWTRFGTGSDAWAWTSDPGNPARTRPLVSCRLVRNGDEYLGQYWSSGIGANGSWCVTPDNPQTSQWVSGETIWVFV